MKKLALAIAAFLLLGGGYFATKMQEPQQDAQTLAGVYSSPVVLSASSTTFTLTTASQRLLASTTSHVPPTKRVAATIQPIHCTLGAGHAIYLNMNRDVAATALNGFAVFASTTAPFEDYPGILPVQGSVTGITQTGTCTVLVTEWKTPNQ
jgi:hypothetical protein